MSFLDSRGRRFSAVLGIFALLFAFNSYAQSPPQGDTRPVATLRDAFARALEANPNLRGQRFALTAADARVDQAALRPAIEVGIEAENILGTNRLSTIDDSEIT